MLTPKQIGMRILAQRQRLAITQEALAAVSDVSTETIRRLELGTINPKIATFNKVAAGLQVTASSLLAENVIDEANELLLGLPPRDQQIAFVMIRGLAEFVAAGR